MDVCVSIICNVFNHENYIRDALESFVMQKTNFKFEILVHDDASTDKSANIIREFEKKYPDLIKPIYQTENQYSKGGGLVGKIQLARATGKYIAVCEGDDYWTDPLKLQKQYDAMEAHTEVDICTHCAMRINAETKECIGYIRPSKTDDILSMEQVIMGGGGYVATNSIMYRREMTFNPPKFREFLRLDYTLQMHGSMRGGMLYLADCMSAYRVMSKGSWTERMKKDRKKFENHTNKVIKCLEFVNEETEFKYSDIIKKEILKAEFHYLNVFREYKRLKDKKYKELYHNLSLKAKCYINLNIYLPWILKCWDKIKGR